MKKETLGAALFFCGFGMLLSLFGPLASWLIRLLISIALMAAGWAIGCGCR